MTAEQATLELARALIRRRSATPQDDGCQQLIGERLKACGFELEVMPFGAVQNLWARRGRQTPLLVFAGHTDVVPAGPLEAWNSDPFTPEVHDGFLYGRGAADMKGSLAAMVVAAERFTRAHPDHAGSIAFLLTSDEEGVAVDGTCRVVEALQARDERIDYCVVGEPSSRETLGDTLKHGRRGSLTGRLTVRGIQGHVAYPHLADNPIHRLAPALAELCAIEWDRGTKDFPPTSFQVSNLTAGTGADNVIPGSVEVLFNLRYSTALTAADIQQRIQELLDRHGLDCQLEWRHSGAPFLTRRGRLIETTIEAVREVTGVDAELSTAGGTSDGRFIAPTGAEVVELGPVNASIHQVNEHVRVDDLDRLSKIYQTILRRLLLRSTQE
jgi:succinyl-diaminopimelate desuccinylase